MRGLTRLWILFSAWAVSAGWILSAGHELNRVGYAVALALAGGGWLAARGRQAFGGGENLRTGLHALGRRLRRPMPALFLVLAALSLLDGVLYPPGNGDTNSYRIPRVFHWLGSEQWHWIHTYDNRMNIAGTGYEWLCAPLTLFTGYDRCFFLINWISYLLLPGLIYGVFIRLGVRRRVAWWWMWILPTGWCYMWQAHSTVNDSFGVIYALASVYFALRGRETGKMGEWWLAVLAAALLTGVKQTCIPLALVSAVALWPGLRAMLARPLQALLVLAVALLVSPLPITIFNLQHTGNWMGLSKDPSGWTSTTVDSPFWGVMGNTFCLTVENLKPPLFPLDKPWNAAMRHFVGTPFGSHFKSFERFGYLSQATSDASSGIGMFVCVLILFSLWWAWRRQALAPARVEGLTLLLWLAPWVSVLAFMAKIGSFENARQMAAYYVFLFPALLSVSGQALIIRQWWWGRVAGLISVLTILILVSSRGEALFPAETIFGWVHERKPQSQFWAHVLASFSSREAVRIQRDAFRADLPPEEKVVGYYSVACCGSEPGLWQPFGIRRVERILPSDDVGRARALGIHYVVLDQLALNLAKQSVDDWMRTYHAELVDQVVFTTVWGDPPGRLYLARLLPEPGR